MLSHLEWLVSEDNFKRSSFMNVLKELKDYTVLRKVSLFELFISKWFNNKSNFLDFWLLKN